MRYLLLALLAIPFTLYAQTNRALLITIGEYSLKEYGWRKLNSLNDYFLIESLLIANNFSAQNIRALKDKEATKQNIVSAFNLLKQQTRAGDYIYIHFSGHGQQMADDNFDEDDGWDEAFVPYDAYYRHIPGHYEGENHLRDDELNVFLTAIRLKAGPTGNVVVVMDACHSATGTRAEEDEFIRGTDFPFGYKSKTNDEFDIDRYKEERDASKQINKLVNNPRMAPITEISACQANEANREYKLVTKGIHYGRLSYALYNLLSKNPTGYTVRGLIKAIETSEIYTSAKEKQTPYCESTIEHKTFKLGR
ncbi:caspase family protein [Bacteroides sp. 519]|uniref:caspase family protein n=1 Tax=Bacteroides sp. 519 TaxID=2302937 RepID=UPI0013D6A597|nr:caspase family protein [Bacteroides sp. 519]NDV57271.1 caspase family protein [Bacteroides sp. 519]